MTDPAFGAYGLVPTGAPLDTRWWNRAPEDWMDWEISWRPLHEAPREYVAGEDRMVLRHQPTGVAVIERAERRSTLYLPEPLSADGLVHPYLGSTVVTVTQWFGWDSFHAGSVAVDGGVWAILGEREEGKSSTVAWMAAHDYPVVADDVLVIRDGTVLAGPRALDLRRTAHEHFGMGCSIGVVGTRERWRHHLPPVGPVLPFRGWVVLEWGEDVSISEVPLEARFRYLLRARALVGNNRPAASWLDLVSMPMVVFTRPRRWETLDHAMKLLMHAIGTSTPVPR